MKNIINTAKAVRGRATYPEENPSGTMLVEEEIVKRNNLYAVGWGVEMWGEVVGVLAAQAR